MKKKVFAVPENITGRDIKWLRKKLNLTQAESAELFHVSKKTIERWEASTAEIPGPAVTLFKILNEYPQIPENLKIPKKIYPIRLWYMNQNDICTVIDVDERNRKVAVNNFTNNFILRAFGREEKPTFEQYEEFLESRCFPRSRDKMKLILEDLNLPFYDPFMIIEKTQRRMAEDNCWIKIERN